MAKPLWAPWRLEYIQQAGEDEVCVFCAEAAGELAGLTSDEVLELHALGVAGIDALGLTYGPGGFNLGWNLGRAAGAGIADHVHLHVVPRWLGDTNFMPVLADVKVLPEHLLETRDRLREAWA